jgi:hypothetical protein
MVHFDVLSANFIISIIIKIMGHDDTMD